MTGGGGEGGGVITANKADKRTTALHVTPLDHF